jgi:hypothetical protein
MLKQTCAEIAISGRIDAATPCKYTAGGLITTSQFADIDEPFITPTSSFVCVCTKANKRHV